jgi:hypothetical protein
MSYTPVPDPQPVVPKSRSGNYADISRYGQMIIGERHDDILARFEYNTSTKDVIVAASGTGATSNANSMATVASGTGVGVASLQSIGSIMYRPAHEAYAYFTSVYSAGQDANTYQYHGCYDAQDGFFFGYSGTTFGTFIRKGGATTFTARTSWNGDKVDGAGLSGFNLNPATLNQYKIEYGWLGISPISYLVYGGQSRGWITVHTIDRTNLDTTPHVLSPSLPLRIESGRTSGTGTTVTVSVGSWAGGATEGVHSHAGHRVFAGLAVKTLLANVETLIASFRNESTFQSKINKIRIEAVYSGFSCDGAKNTTFKFYRNSTITAPSWGSVDATNSVTSVDTTGTIAGGTFELAVPLGKADNAQLDLGAGHIHLQLLPGETMSIVGLSAAASDVQVAFRWEEYFS